MPRLTSRLSKKHDGRSCSNDARLHDFKRPPDLSCLSGRGSFPSLPQLELMKLYASECDGLPVNSDSRLTECRDINVVFTRRVWLPLIPSVSCSI